MTEKIPEVVRTSVASFGTECIYIAMEFHQRLTQILDDRGVSQAKLSRMTGLAQSAISEICSEKRRPYFDQIQDIATAIGMTIDGMLGADAVKLSEADQVVLDGFRESGLSAYTALKAITEAQKKSGEPRSTFTTEVDARSPVSKRKSQ